LRPKWQMVRNMAECDKKGVPGKEAGFSQKPQPVSSPVLPVQ
jgi:hypothetical protein